MRTMWCTCISFFVLICTAKCAKILCLMHVPSYSYYTVYHTLYKELALRGHNVTLISPYVEESPIENLKSYVQHVDMDKFNEIIGMVGQAMYSNILSKNIFVEESTLFLTEQFLNDTNVQKLIKRKEQFDLIIMQQNQNEAMKGLCYHLNAPCVLISTFAASRWTNPIMSNSGPPSYVPELYTDFQNNMNFFERLYNSVVYFIFHSYTHLYTYPKHDILLQKYFPNPPSLYDVMYNTSLMLINSHYSIFSAVPYGPNIIEVGGLHVKPPNPLPNKLQTFLNNAKHGAIYFSLGSNMKSTFLTENVKTVILNTLAKLKQRVLCKWEEEVHEKFDNVIVQKWFPQTDILAHPNIRLFITQGGQMSTTEAVYHGVPLLGLPLYLDQHSNMANAANSGYGIRIPLRDLTQEEFHSALNELLNNSTYYHNAKKRSRLFHDQPMKPLDRAVFWIEHVIRHGGAPHLKTAAANLTWYQYFLLDVICVLVLIFVLAVLAVTLTFQFLGRQFIMRTDLLKKSN